MFLVELIASSFPDLISKQARPEWHYKRGLVYGALFFYWALQLQVSVLKSQI